LAIGLLAQHGRYNALFIACGVMYLIAFGLILLTVRKVQPLHFEPAHAGGGVHVR
jgi:hypothetical protein